MLQGGFDRTAGITPAADDPRRAVVELELTLRARDVAGDVDHLGLDEDPGAAKGDPGAEVLWRDGPAAVGSDRRLGNELPRRVGGVGERDLDLAARLDACRAAGDDHIVILEGGDAVVAFERVIDGETGLRVEEDKAGFRAGRDVAGTVGDREHEGHGSLTERGDLGRAQGQSLRRAGAGALARHHAAGRPGHRHGPGRPGLGADDRHPGRGHRLGGVDHRSGRRELQDRLRRRGIDPRGQLVQRIDLEITNATEVSQQRRRAARGEHDRIDPQAFELGLGDVLRRLARRGVTHQFVDDVGQPLQFGHRIDRRLRLGVDHVAEQGGLRLAVDAGHTQGGEVLELRALRRACVAGHAIGGRQHPGIGVHDGLDLGRGVGGIFGLEGHGAVDGVQVAVDAGSNTGDAEVLVMPQRGHNQAIGLTPATDDPWRAVVEFEFARRLRRVACRIAGLDLDLNAGAAETDPAADIGRRGDPAPGGVDGRAEFDLLRRVVLVGQGDLDLTALLDAERGAGDDEVVVLEGGDAVVAL